MAPLLDIKLSSKSEIYKEKIFDLLDPRRLSQRERDKLKYETVRLFSYTCALFDFFSL